MSVYADSASLYDLIYSAKDYQGETEKLLGFVRQHAARLVASWLDVACGTGGHLMFLRQHFSCCGVDISPELLAVARAKLNDLPLYQGDMCTLELGSTFDVVSCLFSAIGYVQTLDRLRQAVHALARHVMPGGLLLVEPWFQPGSFYDGHLSAQNVDLPDIKIARVSISHVRDRLSTMDMHHLVATREQGVRYFTEVHEMGLFTREEYLEAFHAAGLYPLFDEQGLTGRGLIIGLKGIQDMTV